MKNTIGARIARLWGIVALVAVIGFSMAACDDGGGDDGGGGNPGKLTITGLGDYNGKYVYGQGSDSTQTKTFMAVKSLNMLKNEIVGEKINGGSVALNVLELDTENYKSKGYNGSGSLLFVVYVWDKEKPNPGEVDTPIAGARLTVAFTNGTASAVFVA